MTIRNCVRKVDCSILSPRTGSRLDSRLFLGAGVELSEVFDRLRVFRGAFEMVGSDESQSTGSDTFSGSCWKPGTGRVLSWSEYPCNSMSAGLVLAQSSLKALLSTTPASGTFKIDDMELLGCLWGDGILSWSPRLFKLRRRLDFLKDSSDLSLSFWIEHRRL